MADYILDMETLGQCDNAVILSVALLACNESLAQETSWANVLTYGKQWKLRISEQGERGRVKEASTIKWWSEQSEDAREILSATGRQPVNQVLNEMVEFIEQFGYDKKENLVYSRGLIDIRWLDSLCGGFGHDPIFPWWNGRDTRTICHILLGHPSAEVELPADAVIVKHNALVDCALDYFRLKKAFNL